MFNWWHLVGIHDGSSTLHQGKKHEDTWFHFSVYILGLYILQQESYKCSHCMISSCSCFVTVKDVSKYLHLLLRIHTQASQVCHHLSNDRHTRLCQNEAESSAIHSVWGQFLRCQNITVSPANWRSSRRKQTTLVCGYFNQQNSGTLLLGNGDSMGKTSSQTCSCCKPAAQGSYVMWHGRLHP